MTLILHDPSGARLVDDSFVRLDDGASLPLEGDVIVSIERLRRDRLELRARAGRLGVHVTGDADPEAVAAELEGVALVVIELPKFTDGRAYSLARMLRDRHGYAGELRASGEVLRDQLFYLARCGFTSFVLAPGRDAADALRAFDDFSVTYQPAVDHDQPVWRRRAAR